MRRQVKFFADLVQHLVRAQGTARGCQCRNVAGVADLPPTWCVGSARAPRPRTVDSMPPTDQAYSRTSYPRTGWPWLEKMTPDDVAEAVALAGDEDLPEWALKHLPLGHPDVLDALLGRERLSSPARRCAFEQLNRGHWAQPGTDRAAAASSWAQRVAAATWLTPTRFRKLTITAADFPPAAVLPALSTHRHFTRAAAGRVVDVVWVPDRSWQHSQRQGREPWLTAMAELGEGWEQLAAVFTAALKAGYGRDQYPLRASLAAVGALLERCRPDTLAAVAALLPTMSAAPLTHIVELADVATTKPGKSNRRRTSP